MNKSHHLAAILFTDIEGYTAMMQEDEARAIAAVHSHNAAAQTYSQKHGGKVANYYGDGCLIIFKSCTEAIECAIEIQRELSEAAAIPVRIGLHLGEISFEDDKVFGDGVNVASRVQTLGVGNSILFSEAFYENIRNQSEFKPVSLGNFHFKNVSKPMEVFALGNEGLKIPSKNQIHGKLEAKTRIFAPKWLLAAVIFIVLATVYLLYRNQSSVQESNFTDKSIAVLAFSDMSTGKDYEYLGDGIAEEILNSLCKFEDLKVVARTSSFSFKNKNVDIKTIGEKLNVSNILEGSVRMNQDKINITVRLTNAKSGFTLLSESFTDDLQNIFDLQSTIAIEIAGKIEAKLSNRERQLLNRRKINSRAYEAYLKGRAQFLNGPLNMVTGEIFNAKKYFEAAVQIDTTFTDALAFLSLAYFNLADWAVNRSESEYIKIALDSAILLAKKAIAIDSLNSGAHLAMGSYYFHQYDWIRAEKAKRKAVELNPGGAEEKYILASFLGQFGQEEEALKLDRQAMILDPLDPNGRLKYARDLYRARLYDEAIAQSRIVLQENPNSPGAYQFFYLCYSGKNQLDSAGLTLTKLWELRGNTEMAKLFHENDYKTAWKIYLNNLPETLPVHPLPYMMIAQAYAEIGDRDNTLKYLNIIYEKHLTNITFLCQHMFDFIREDPSYFELIEKAGFKAYYDFKEKLASSQLL